VSAKSLLFSDTTDTKWEVLACTTCLASYSKPTTLQANSFIKFAHLFLGHDSWSRTNAIAKLSNFAFDKLVPEPGASYVRSMFSLTICTFKCRPRSDVPLSYGDTDSGERPSSSVQLLLEGASRFFGLPFEDSMHQKKKKKKSAHRGCRVVRVLR
jgi:hypothetical protein